MPGAEAPVAPTHWSFGQLANLVGAPAAYLRQLPAPLAGVNLKYGLTNHRAEQVKTFEAADGRVELRAVTGPITAGSSTMNWSEAVRRIAGNGTGDTRWKVPGVLDWSTSIYNPGVDITKDTTTLYASDRDVFIFLVDDLNPAEAGRPIFPDLYFRGFYCWNSEVAREPSGSAASIFAPSAGIAIYGASRISREITIRHSKYAASRFAHEAAPALLNFAQLLADTVHQRHQDSRERLVARNDEIAPISCVARLLEKRRRRRSSIPSLTEEGARQVDLRLRPRHHRRCP